MAATTPAAFDPKPRSLNSQDFIAGAPILAGQSVALNGVADWTVIPTVKGTTTQPVGVALYSQPTVGAKVSVAIVGSILKVCEANGAAIPQGTQVQDSTVSGCVQTAVAAAGAYMLGIALSGIPANGTGYVLVNPSAKST
jgi:hypothetical protein